MRFVKKKKIIVTHTNKSFPNKTIEIKKKKICSLHPVIFYTYRANILQHCHSYCKMHIFTNEKPSRVGLYEYITYYIHRCAGGKTQPTNIVSNNASLSSYTEYITCTADGIRASTANRLIVLL